MRHIKVEFCSISKEVGYTAASIFDTNEYE